MSLSACETPLGRDAGGEGFVGFTQALLMSGARSVCLALWKVDNAATALLMQRFIDRVVTLRVTPIQHAEHDDYTRLRSSNQTPWPLALG